MDEWLHCNHCYTQFGRSNPVKFYITNCAHIFCEKCEKTATVPVCIVCNERCKTAILNEKLDPYAATFFKPPQELEKKAGEVRRFQENQRRRLTKKLIHKLEQQNQLLQSSAISIEKLKKDNAKLKSENSDIRRFLRHNKANLSISPNSSFLMCNSPEPSPRGTPRISPHNMITQSPLAQMRISPSPQKGVFPSPRKRISPSPAPNIGRQQKAQFSSSSSAPNTPNQIRNAGNMPNNQTPQWGDFHNKGKRVIISSPPVDGRIPCRSPSASQLYRQGYVTSNGIVSKQASVLDLHSSPKPKFKYPPTPKQTLSQATPHSTPTAYLKPAGQFSTPQPSSKFCSYYGLSAKRKF